MKTFKTYEEVSDMSDCIKKRIVVHCKRMKKPFKVIAIEGIAQGKAGDYLMRGILGELYICRGDIFLKSYDIIN